MLALEVRKVSHWPRAPFDVYGKTDSWFADPDGWERFAGGFFTRRGAQEWIERERKDATTTID